MKTTRLLALLFVFASPLRAQTHNHINAGVDSSGDKLAFVNGADYDLASGFVLNLTYKIANRYAGTFSGNITFTALGIDPSVGGPEPGHADPGAHLVLQLVAVTGPAGATFSFWDATGSAPAVSFAVGAAGSSSSRWDLSENDGLPGEDPFGHIHNRQFSVDQPGTYVATFQLFDTSTNGSAGGPLHSPSDAFQMKFVAVPEPAAAALLGLGGIVLAAGILARRRRRNLSGKSAASPSAELQP